MQFAQQIVHKDMKSERMLVSSFTTHMICMLFFYTLPTQPFWLFQGIMYSSFTKYIMHSDSPSRIAIPA